MEINIQNNVMFYGERQRETETETETETERQTETETKRQTGTGTKTDKYTLGETLFYGKGTPLSEHRRLEPAPHNMTIGPTMDLSHTHTTHTHSHARYSPQRTFRAPSVTTSPDAGSTMICTGPGMSTV